LMANN